MRILVSDPKDDNDNHPVIKTHVPSYCCKGNANRTCSLCEYIDAQELSWPIESHTINLMTFGKDRWQVKQRNDSFLKQEFVNIREKKYFTVNPEEVMIKVEHSIVATRFTRKSGKEQVAASQRSMKGYLYDAQGKIIQSIPATNFKKPGLGQADKLTVQELLNAAGIDSLEQPSDALNAKGKSFRRHGMVLHVGICYHNTETTLIGTGNIEYSYHVRRIPYADYRINQVIPIIGADDFSFTDDKTLTRPEKRLFRKRYGIKIEFHQSGKLGRFSLPALLLKLVSGVGLLTLTATIVDTAALYLLPDRFQYREFVYEESPVIDKRRCKGGEQRSDETATKSKKES
ncbi:P2X receptor E isoform X2 [Nematostella vectensis]|nr:P2X receptor E isoform X2 [Nematostella vectensis]